MNVITVIKTDEKNSDYLLFIYQLDKISLTKKKMKEGGIIYSSFIVHEAAVKSLLSEYVENDWEIPPLNMFVSESIDVNKSIRFKARVITTIFVALLLMIVYLMFESFS